MTELCSINNVPKAAQLFLDSCDDFKVDADSTDLCIHRCPVCSHVQQNSSIVSYNLDVITTASLSPLTLQKRDSVIDNLVSKISVEDPSIIEIGAYRGQYVNYLLQRGFKNVVGLEHGMDSLSNPLCPSDHIKQGHVHDLPTHFINQYSESCDLLLCFNFLEHSTDPHLFMRGIASLLKQGAYVYFTLPSVDYILRESLIQEFVPDHISYFTSRSLSTLFSIFGFSICSLLSINNDNDLEIIAQYNPGNSSQVLSSSPFNKLVDELNDIINFASSNNKNVAFWGAGHRSLTLISQLKYNGIDCVVDSASFKQNRFTPVSHLPIISPNDLMHSDIDILILSLPGVYNIEVAEEIKTWPSNPPKMYSITGNKLSKIY